MKFKSLFAVSLLATLAGCITAPFNESMTALMSMERARGTAGEYLPGSTCSYRSEIRAPGATPQVLFYNVTTRAIGDRIQIIMHEDKRNDPTTILMDNRGVIVDFNSVNPANGQRITREDRAQIEALVAQGLMLEFRYLFPAYLSRAADVGERAAIVRIDDGTTWGRYIHRGYVRRGGRPTQVLELQLPDQNGNLTRAGFGFFGANGMPVEVMVGTERNFRLMQCS